MQAIGDDTINFNLLFLQSINFSQDGESRFRRADYDTVPATGVQIRIQVVWISVSRFKIETGRFPHPQAPQNPAPARPRREIFPGCMLTFITQ